MKRESEGGPAPSTECPCGERAANGKPLAWQACCGRFIDHWEQQPAPDAERLMRSRYSAFVTGNTAYLCATWHHSARPAELELDTQARWLGLQVKAFVPQGPDTAQVEFVARWREAGRAVRLHERSRFVREQGRWYYLDGEQFDKL